MKLSAQHDSAFLWWRPSVGDDAGVAERRQEEVRQCLMAADGG